MNSCACSACSGLPTAFWSQSFAAAYVLAGALGRVLVPRLSRRTGTAVPTGHLPICSVCRCVSPARGDPLSLVNTVSPLASQPTWLCLQTKPVKRSRPTSPVVIDADDPEEQEHPAVPAAPETYEGSHECPICKEATVAAHSFVPCGHCFCGECIGDWLTRKTTCPECRWPPALAGPLAAACVHQRLHCSSFSVP